MVITASPILCIDPISVDVRGLEFPIRVTSSLTGAKLPVLIFCHGAEYSRADYQPMVEVLARGGFIVIQPSHPDEFSFADNPRMKRIWHDRVMQVSGIIDQGESLFDNIQSLANRADWSRVVCAGHSYGGHTVANLLGARAFDSEAGEARDLRDSRIRAGAILAAPGNIALDSETGQMAPHMNIDFSHMGAPAIIVAGKQDDSSHVGRDWTWHTDPFTDGPAPKTLLLLPKAGHYLHGVTGRKRIETGAEDDQEQVTALSSAILCYLKSEIDPNLCVWREEQVRLAARGMTLEIK